MIPLRVLVSVTVAWMCKKMPGNHRDTLPETNSKSP